MRVCVFVNYLNKLWVSKQSSISLLCRFSNLGLLLWLTFDFSLPLSPTHWLCDLGYKLSRIQLGLLLSTHWLVRILSLLLCNGPREEASSRLSMTHLSRQSSLYICTGNICFCFIKRALKGPLHADRVRDALNKNLINHSFSSKLCMVPVLELYKRNETTLVEVYVLNITPGRKVFIKQSHDVFCRHWIGGTSKSVLSRIKLDSRYE